MCILQNELVQVNFRQVIQNDQMIKNYIILGLISILIAFGIIVSIKCARLERENLQLQKEYTNLVDSIKIENQVLETEITLLNEDLLYLQYKIDSLNNIKQKVIVKREFIVSESLTEGVKLLQENLRCEK